MFNFVYKIILFENCTSDQCSQSTVHIHIYTETFTNVQMYFLANDRTQFSGDAAPEHHTDEITKV